MKKVLILANGRPIANAWLANHYFARLRGLLGRTLSEGGGLLLAPCNCIHTFGMQYEIDAVYLDRTGTVLRVDEALPAGKTCKAQRGARYVLELPTGTARRQSIQEGNRLEGVL